MKLTSTTNKFDIKTKSSNPYRGEFWKLPSGELPVSGFDEKSARGRGSDKAEGKGVAIFPLTTPC
jgi:hypothetical protein